MSKPIQTTTPLNGVPVPASLAKRGIFSVSDNLPEGAYLNVGRAFIQTFRPELEARLIRKGGKPI